VRAVPRFLERRNWERRREDRPWSRRRFLEDLMLRRDATVLVTMATALPNILQRHQTLSALYSAQFVLAFRKAWDLMGPTGFTGDVDMICVWKLNGPWDGSSPFSVEPLAPAPAMDDSKKLSGLKSPDPGLQPVV
jgi:hypothetical protein